MSGRKIKFLRAKLDHINIPIYFNKVNMTLLPAKSRLPAETPACTAEGGRAPPRQPADQSPPGHSICCRPRSAAQHGVTEASVKESRGWRGGSRGMGVGSCMRWREEGRGGGECKQTGHQPLRLSRGPRF